tara:strand:- start:473 stop:685 length:213 start_codon:yes stop_codon:yes gene_type:complete
MGLTRFEQARIVSARALQLALGAPPLVKTTGKVTPYDLSKDEFQAGKLPFIVLRKYPNGTIERVDVTGAN